MSLYEGRPLLGKAHPFFSKEEMPQVREQPTVMTAGELIARASDSLDKVTILLMLMVIRKRIVKTDLGEAISQLKSATADLEEVDKK